MGHVYRPLHRWRLEEKALVLALVGALWPGARKRKKFSVAQSGAGAPKARPARGQPDGPAGLTWWCNRPVESRNPLGQAEQR